MNENINKKLNQELASDIIEETKTFLGLELTTIHIAIIIGAAIAVVLALVLIVFLFVLKRRAAMKTGDSFILNGYVMTHPGRKRANNEDNFNLFGSIREKVENANCEVKSSVILKNDMPLCVSVLDGMGGGKDGEWASLECARMVKPIDVPAKDDFLNFLTGKILTLVNSMNDAVCKRMGEDPKDRIGTTFSGLFFYNKKAVSANVGDSRIYLYRNGKLTQLSHDHSKGQEMIDKGHMSEEEAREYKSWHVLTQCIGAFPEECVLSPFYTEVNLQEKDRFLLCSDGLTDMVRDGEMQKILLNCINKDVVSTAKQLLETALNNGGSDNVTVMLIDVLR